jgi:YYY domain-containing protein
VTASPPSPDRRARAALVAILVLAAVLRLWNLNWDAGQHLHPDERFLAIVNDEVRLPSGPGAYFDGARSPLNPYNVTESFVYGTLPSFLVKAVGEWLDVDPDGSTHATGRAVVGALDTLGVPVRDRDGTVRIDGGYDSNLVGRALAAIADVGTVAMVWAIGRRLVDRRVGAVAALLVATAPLHIQHAHFFVVDPFATAATTGCLLASTLLLERPQRRWAVVAGLAAGAAAACKVSALPVLALPVLALALGHRRDDALVSVRHRVGSALAAVAAASLLFRVAQPYAFDGLISLDPRFVHDLRDLARLHAGGEWPPNVQWAGRTRFLYPLRNLAVDGIGLPFAAAAVAGAVLTVRQARRRALGLLLPLAWAVLAVLVGARGFVAIGRYLLPAVPALGVLAGVAVVTLWDQRRRVAAAARVAAVAGAGAVVLASVLAGVAYTAGVYGGTNSRLEASRWLEEHVPDRSVILTSEWDDALPLRLPGIDPGRWRQATFNHFPPDSRQKVEALVAALDEADFVVESSNRVYGAVGQIPARFPSTLRYYEALFDGSLGFAEVARFTNDPSLFGVEWRDDDAEEAFSVYDHPTVTIWARTSSWSPDRALQILQPDRADAAVTVTPGDADENALQLRPGELEAQRTGGSFVDRFGSADAEGNLGRALRWLLWLEVLSLAALPVATWLGARLPSSGFALAKPIGLFGATTVSWILASWRLVDVGAGLAWAGAGFAVVAGVLVGIARRVELLGQVRAHWRGWLALEVGFVVVFGTFLVLRGLNPDVWHSSRGGEKPMELAYLTALGRSSVLPPVDPWFAGGFLNYYWLGWLVVALPMLALRVVPEVALNLAVPTFAALAAVAAAGVAHDLVGTAGASRRARWSAGVLGVVLLLGIGNLHTAWEAVTGGLGGPFDWWAPSRVHSDCCDITEFPLWTFLFADLHPHLMAVPLIGSFVGLALALVVAGREGERRRGLGLAAAVGVMIGFARAAHTWDVPTMALIVGVAVIGGQVGAVRTWRHRLAAAAVQLLVVAAVASLLGWPHGRGPVLAETELIGSPRRTTVGEHLLHFGLFTVVGLWFLGRRVLESRSSPWAVGRLVRSPVDLLAIAAVVAGVLVAASAGGLVVAAAGAVVALLLVHLLSLEGRTPAELQPGRFLATGLLAIGFAIVAGVEVVTVAPDIERQNTVFKFYEAAWQVLALGGAFAVWYLLRRHRRVVVLVVGVLLLASSAFPVLGVPARLRDRDVDTPATLDGLAFARAGASVLTPDGDRLELSDDVVVAEWLREHVDGMPTIVEAVGPSYAWVGRMSMLTGLPAVVGWDFHQRQQRGPLAPEVTQRRDETTAFYRDGDAVAAARFLRRYEVGYVVVAGAERAYGTPVGAATIAALACTEVVFRHGRDLIYAVTDEPCEAAGPAPP